MEYKSFNDILFKNLIYVVRMCPALYLLGHKVWYGMEQISEPWWVWGGGLNPHKLYEWIENLNSIFESKTTSNENRREIISQVLKRHNV
jgi:hypothetical protein